jgi:toxin ParE1/3/4
LIVRWTTSALRDRSKIFDYIAEDDEAAAEGLDLRFAQVAERLASFPYSARPGAIQGTRELIPHPNYRIVYKIEAQTVFIIRVVHTSRQWPPEPEDNS